MKIKTTLRLVIDVLGGETALKDRMMVDKEVKKVDGADRYVAEFVACASGGDYTTKSKLESVSIARIQKGCRPAFDDPSLVHKEEVKIIHKFTTEFMCPGSDQSALDDTTSYVYGIVERCSYGRKFDPKRLQGAIVDFAWNRGLETIDEGTIRILHDIVIESVLEWNDYARDEAESFAKAQMAQMSQMEE